MQPSRHESKQITISDFDQIINVGFGSNAQVAGWNRYASFALGVLDASLNNNSGAETGVGINVTNAPSGASTQSGLVSEVPDVPSAILTATWADTANSIAYTITGLTPGRSYDILFMSSRATTTVSSTRITVNGTVIGDMPAANNVSSSVLAQNVTANSSGEATVVAGRGSGSYVYLTAMVVKRRAA